jgi:Fic family protein
MYKPIYTISDELLRKIAEIEGYRTKVDSSYILPEREIEMRYRATVEATHSSTSIEGNPLTIKQVEKVLAGDKQLTRRQYAELEVKNYKRALDEAARRSLSKQPISLQDVLSVHGTVVSQLLPAEKVGNLRKNPVYIEDQDEKLRYTGPAPEILNNEIDELLAWIDASEHIHPVIAAAILHFHFVSIHPFADGNGRTTRILTDLYLSLRDYDFKGSLVLDTYYSLEKQAYYDALDISDNYMGRKSASLDSWIHYFADGFLSAAKILSIEVTVLSGLASGVQRIKLAQSEVDLLSYAKQFGQITLVEAESIVVNVSKRTIQRKLMKLVNDGYLVVKGNARDTKYIWREKRNNKQM